MTYEKQPLDAFEAVDEAERAPAGQPEVDRDRAAKAQSAELNALAVEARAPEQAADGSPGDGEAGALDLDALRATVEALLDSAPLGAAARKRRKRYGVSLDFAPGAAGLYDADGNALVLDARCDPALLAVDYVCEIDRARRHHEGRTAHASEMQRADYVDARLLEAAEGALLMIEAAEAFAAADVRPPLAVEYRAAYAAARAAGDDPAQARAAGRARVVQGFRGGEVCAGNTGESLPAYFGAWWDRVHAD